MRLLECTEGRAFCLFTSYSQMNQLFELVRPRSRFPLLLQGTRAAHGAAGALSHHARRRALRHRQASGRAWTCPAISFPA